MNIRTTWKSWITLLFILLFTAACTSSTGEEATTDAEETEHMDEDMEHMDEEMEHDDDMEHDEEMEHDRIPNNGAVIRIVSPADGATFSSDETVIVEVEVENFELGADGNHWHISVDGESWGMVMGTNTDQALNGLEAGTHEIEVLLATGAHEDLQDGDMIEVTVEE